MPWALFLIGCRPMLNWNDLGDYTLDFGTVELGDSRTGSAYLCNEGIEANIRFLLDPRDGGHFQLSGHEEELLAFEGCTLDNADFPSIGIVYLPESVGSHEAVLTAYASTSNREDVDRAVLNLKGKGVAGDPETVAEDCGTSVDEDLDGYAGCEDTDCCGELQCACTSSCVDLWLDANPSTQNLLVNGDFEEAIVSGGGSGWPDVPGEWGGDWFGKNTFWEGVGARSGGAMLRFIGTNPYPQPAGADAACEVVQTIDYPDASQLAGKQLCFASHYAWADVDDETDTLFDTRIGAFEGVPADAPTQLDGGLLVNCDTFPHCEAVETEPEPGAWTPVAVPLSVPADTTGQWTVLVYMGAVENVKNDLDGNELDAHLADDAWLFVLPEP